MWQCVAVCGSVLKCVTVCYNMLYYFAANCSVLHQEVFISLECSVLQCVAVCGSVLQCVTRGGVESRERLACYCCVFICFT